jgi:hypothetical protein
MAEFPGSRVIRVLSHDGWFISIIAVIPWHISAFSQGEISPDPWQVFSYISAIHGAAEEWSAPLIVCIVDM